MATKRTYEKSRMDYNHSKRVIMTRRRTESENSQIYTKTLKKNWKTSVDDGIYGFWFQKFTTIHDRLVLEMKRFLQEAHIPACMTIRKTTLIQKDPLKDFPQRTKDE